VPLPAGLVSIRQPQAAAGGRELFVGEQSVRDVPLNEPFELPAGQASDVTVSQRVTADQTRGSGSGRRERVALEFALTNAKPAPVTFELRQPQLDQPGAAIVAAPATPPATTDLTIIAGRDYAAALTAPSPVSTGSPKM